MSKDNKQLCLHSASFNLVKQSKDIKDHLILCVIFKPCGCNTIKKKKVKNYYEDEESI